MVKSLAWTTAGLSRTDKLPAYDKWMRNESEHEPLSNEQIAEKKLEREAIMAEIREARARAKSENQTNGN